jgi:hypothetical protein
MLFSAPSACAGASGFFFHLWKPLVPLMVKEIEA